MHNQLGRFLQYGNSLLLLLTFTKEEYEYFDSFGLPPPLEWEKGLINKGEISSKAKDKGKIFKTILKMFSDDVYEND